MPTLFDLAFAATHVLASAAWFGAMLYSYAVLSPGATRFFTKGDDLEVFLTTVAAGARWKVLTGLAIIALSGAGLTWTRYEAAPAWSALIAVKTICWFAAIALFWVVSWRLCRLASSLRVLTQASGRRGSGGLPGRC